MKDNKGWRRAVRAIGFALLAGAATKVGGLIISWLLAWLALS
ncbi:hypothetical protein [Streptomyces sp. NPDC058247]